MIPHSECKPDDVTVLVPCHPDRYNFAWASLRFQWYESIMQNKKYVCSKAEPVSKHLVDFYANSIPRVQTPYVAIIMGDTEVPLQFLDRGLHHDVYGIPIYDSNEKRVRYGLIPCTLQYAREMDMHMFVTIYPDNAVMMITEIAKKFKWTHITSFGKPDSLYPFMEWADKEGYEIFLDKTLCGVHHSEDKK